MKKTYWLALTLYLAGCASVKKSIVALESKYNYAAGFYLYNPTTEKELLAHNASQYFTPASNTKVYTLYAANSVLPDSIPAYRYLKTDTALWVWGLANPVFLNPLLPQGSSYAFLKQQPKLYLSTTNFIDTRFGPGWAWDDYNGSYAQEKTGFPVYGNSVDFILDSLATSLKVLPQIFADSISQQTGDKFKVQRQEFSNRFEVTTGNCEDCERKRPIYFTKNTLQNLLQDTLNIPVEVVQAPVPDHTNIYYCIPKDSVLKVMMQQSDNFLAEHLLLQVAAMQTDTLSTQLAIRNMTPVMESFLPDPMVWRDGSGLSRYNLVTPRNTVALWQELYKQMGQDRLFSLISAGGKAGTLAHWFAAEPAYIYGKTGTLTHVFCLSGFLVAKSGKILIFSYMNNNYAVPSAIIKKEMEPILRRIYEKY